MKHLLLPVCLAFLCMPGRAQQVIDLTKTNAAEITSSKDISSGINGMLYRNDKYVRVSSGTPFFKEHFMKATLYDTAGNKYKGEQVRLNLLDNQINYLDSAGQEIVVSSPISRLILTDTTNGNQYTFVKGDQLQVPDKTLQGAWIRFLVNGPASLCLLEKKAIHETIPYGNATTEENIRNVNTYYVRINGKFVQAKSWQDFLNLLSDKKEAIDQYVQEHHLKGKSTADYVHVVKYYNGVCV